MSNLDRWEQDDEDDFDKVGPLPPDETWLTSYGDLMTILLVFFVLLISASQVSSIEFEKIKKAFRTPEPDEHSISKIHDALIETIDKNDLSDLVKIEEDDKSIAITLPGKMLFDLGKAELRSETLDVLDEITSVLVELPPYARVAIEGHTDDNPVGEASYSSNWHLSALRALAVLERLDQEGACGQQCELRGFGEHRPVQPNRDEDGQVIIDHQSLNRRVVIRVF